MEKVVLIDGNNLIFRSYYATAYRGELLTNSKGLPTNAIYAYVQMLIKIIAEEKPTHIMVAFDKGKTFRHESYDDYKGGRSETPKELKEQIPYAKKVTRAMGITVEEIENYEADDIIGTYSKKIDEEVLVVSSDRDLLQLLSPNVKMKLLKMKDYVYYDEKSFYEDYGIKPIEIIDLKALMGDSSDNIKGVTGIGEKTALKLIKEYHTIDNLYKNIDNLKEDEVTKCPSCGVLFHKSEIRANMKMCPNCNHYFNMSARERIELLIDEGTFKEEDATLTSANPINFPEYAEKIEKAQHDSGMNEGVISGIGELNGIKVSIACMDFNFMGGSMGSVVGEKITAALERAIEHKIPAVVVAISGGARMQEGLTSLMQMAKTSAAVKKMRLAGLPFISVPVNPTTGGVTASFAMLGDIIISEPKARIGFAGPRVIEQTIRQKLPENFQKSEFLQECGMVDIIAKREDLKATIFKVLNDII